jgi:hypothetical protein
MVGADKTDSRDARGIRAGPGSSSGERPNGVLGTHTIWGYVSLQSSARAMSEGPARARRSGGNPAPRPHGVPAQPTIGYNTLIISVGAQAADLQPHLGHATAPARTYPAGCAAVRPRHPRPALAWLPPKRCQPRATTDGRASTLGDARRCHHRLRAEAALGLGSGDRFEGFRGGSGSFEGMVERAKKALKLQEKRSTKRCSEIA